MSAEFRYLRLATFTSPRKLPPDALEDLKDEGFIKVGTASTSAVLACATCPNAESPFYVQRAVDCTDMQSGVVSPIVSRLNEAGALQNKRVEDRRAEGKPTRVLYDTHPKVRDIIDSAGISGTQGCIFEKGKDSK